MATFFPFQCREKRAFGLFHNCVGFWIGLGTTSGSLLSPVLRDFEYNGILSNIFFMDPGGTSASDTDLHIMVSKEMAREEL
jgi:hypothetical protein